VTTEHEQTRFAILQYVGNFLVVTAKDGHKPSIQQVLKAAHEVSKFVFVGEPRAKDGPKLIAFDGAGPRAVTEIPVNSPFSGQPGEPTPAQ
jgi:hypothetical protein